MNNQTKRSHNFKDITGQIFGMITVVDYSHTDGKVAKWNCVCSCGASRVVPGTALRSGNTRSCGHDRAKNAGEAASLANTTHGMDGSREMSSWKSMRERCLSRNHKSYIYYKDVVICEEWLNSFVQFYADMGDRPAGTTLDRIDNNKGYSPDNCRWATHKQQANNRSSSRFVTHRGETLTVSQWAEKTGIPRDTLAFRFKVWSIESALTAPYPCKTKMQYV